MDNKFNMQNIQSHPSSIFVGSGYACVPVPFSIYIVDTNNYQVKPCYHEYETQPACLSASDFQVSASKDTLIEKIKEAYCFCVEQEREKPHEEENKQVSLSELHPPRNTSLVVKKKDPPKPRDSDHQNVNNRDEHAQHYILRGFRYKAVKVPIDFNGGVVSKRTKTIYKCLFESCRKTFSKAWNFRDHYLMHQGSKPYTCDVCRNRFTQKGNLKKHMRQHEKPDLATRKTYQCPACPKSYTERYNLRVSF